MGNDSSSRKQPETDDANNNKQLENMRKARIEALKEAEARTMEMSNVQAPNSKEINTGQAVSSKGVKNVQTIKNKNSSSVPTATSSMQAATSDKGSGVKLEEKKLPDTQSSSQEDTKSLEMAEEIPLSAVTGILQDVQSTSRLMLTKLNEAVAQHTTCTCECHSSEKYKDLDEVKRRLASLEEEGQQKDELLRQLTAQLHDVHTSLTQLQHAQTQHPHPGDTQPTTHTQQQRQQQRQHETGSEAASRELSVELSDTVVNKNTGGSTEDAAKAGIVDNDNDNKSGVTDNATDTVEDAVIQLDTSTDSSTGNEAVEMSGDIVEFVSEDDSQSQGSERSVTTLGATRSGGLVIQGEDSDTGSNRSTASRASSGILKPNFRVSTPTTTQTQQQQPCQVEVIHQRQAMSFPSEQTWLAMATDEVRGAEESGLKDLGGAHTVVCVDISASMAQGGGWNQTQTFCRDYFNGLAKMAAEHGLDDEHVALVTFGHDCRVLQRLTNKMDDVLQKFDSLQLGGPSPMYAGLYFAIAAAISSEKRSFHMKGVRVDTKIIVITDGEPTDARLYKGPDTEEAWKKDQTIAHVLEAIEKFREMRADLYFVPVGNSNRDFFELMKSVGDAKILSHKDGDKTAHRLFLQCQLQPMDFLGLSLGGANVRGADLSASDRELMEELKEEGKKKMFADLLSGQLGDKVKDRYRESTNENFPPIGTRVRRGPDWSWKDQDSNGPGTVIGHASEGGQLWVHWDAEDHMNVYNYDGRNYDVLPVDEPRIISMRDRLQVGCAVKPGKDWSHSDTSVKSFDRGIVIKQLSDGTKLEVRWTNGKRGEYEHSVSGKQEIEYSAPAVDSWPTHGGYTLGSGETPKRTKNKNKNQ